MISVADEWSEAHRDVIVKENEFQEFTLARVWVLNLEDLKKSATVYDTFCREPEHIEQAEA